MALDGARGRSRQRTLATSTAVERAEASGDPRETSAGVGEDDDRRATGLELETGSAVENSSRDTSDGHPLDVVTERRRVVEREAPPARGPHLDLDGRRAARVAERRAVAVDERDELGVARAAKHRDERMPFDAIARKEKKIDLVGETRALGRRSAPSGSGAYEPEHGKRAQDAADQRARQWFTWWRGMNAVQPSDEA